MKSRPLAGTPFIPPKGKLRSAALTVAVLVLFVGLVLTALFLLVLPGLAALLVLSLLSGLTALLALSELVTLFLHIVRHKNNSPEKARTYHAFEI
jgi:hypothetical protein